jgi:ATP-dependent DNA helicase RecG
MGAKKMKWWQESIKNLKGIGPKRIEAFNRLNVHTIGDLLNFYPRMDSYIDNSKILKIRDLATDGSSQLFKGEVLRAVEHFSARGKRYCVVSVRDDSGYANLFLFGAQRFQVRHLHPETELLIRGRVKPGRGGKTVGEVMFQILDGEHPETLQGIQPVYNLTETLTQNIVRQAVKKALALAEAQGVAETIPPVFVKKYGYLDRLSCLKNIHFPESIVLQKAAKKRLIYEELFLLQCGLLLNREHNHDNREGIKHGPDGKLVTAVRHNFPFSLTKAQEQAWREISDDMESHKPMHRLLQGDVGSGKTAVAALALAKTAENGFQGCLMAPTGILAYQHLETLQQFFKDTNITLALLTSSTKPAEREAILAGLASGKLQVIIGTHALLQEDVHFAHLALVITDEQHRFGVNQRAALVSKSGFAPDVLVMTATPIPRTLALTVYGDVDVSSMRGMPPGRKKVQTLCYTGDMRDKVYAGLVRQVREGRQAYVICPSIEEVEGSDMKSVNDVYEHLRRTWLKDIPCALLHGKLKNAEKEQIMEDFAAGKLKVLITTTVIEVGVNVPNATLMIVENADRFGLAQLHQLRGRVGRGQAQSFCVLLTDNMSDDSLARLQVLHESSDGFELSEKDLELRGAGQLFGLRQHGLPDLFVADILRDTEVLVNCRKDAIQALADKELRQQVMVAVENQFDERFSNIFKV